MCVNIILSPPNCTICKLMALKRMCERNKDTTKWLYKNIGQTDLFWDHPYVTSTKDWVGGTTLTSLIKGHVRLFFPRKKSSLPSDFHVID